MIKHVPIGRHFSGDEMGGVLNEVLQQRSCHCF